MSTARLMTTDTSRPTAVARTSTTTHLCALQVEDSEGDAELVQLELRRGGYDVESERVETAAAMNAALKERSWDVVLADWVLPAFSGAAALAVVHESGLDLPFIIISGEIGEDVAVTAMKAGAHDYLLKNNLTRLVPAVERELREAVMRRERLQAEAEAAERARLAALGADVGVALTRGGDLRVILQGCAEGVVRHLNAAAARIWTMDDDGERLALQAGAGLPTQLDSPDRCVPLSQEPIGRIAAERAPYVSNHVIGDPRVPDQEWARREQLLAFAGYPLAVEDRTVGVLALFARRALSDFTCGALRAVADEIAIGIEHKRVEIARQEEAQVARALARMGNELITSLALPTLLERLCHRTTEILPCDFSATLLAHPRESIYVPLAHYGGSPEQWEAVRALRLTSDLFAGVHAHLCDADVVQVRPAESIHPLVRSVAEELGIGVLLYTALRRGKDLCGLQIAGYRDRGAAFSRVQERIATGTSHLASVTLEHARTLEELEHANRLKSDFVATMSHELRTPLNIIMGYNELLLEGELGPLTVDQRDALQRTQTNAYNLLELITATLDMSRLEAGQSPLDLHDIAVPDLIEQIDAETHDLQQKSGVHFEWGHAADLPHVCTDPVKLKVVLKNLISNAMKFTEQGRVRVDVSARDGGVQFEVIDTGIGILPDMLPVIFDLFRQGDSSMTRPYPGVGLGLYIARRLVELLGGTISVDSAAGRGSAFRVWVPTARR
jgi:signal transduction histidine kinase/FixJ family two-component response regulator